MDMSWNKGLSIVRHHTVTDHLKAMVGALNEAGLGVRVHPDPNAFADFVRKVDGHDPVSALDPAFVRLDASNFFWIQIMKDMVPVSIGATRLLHLPAWRGGLDRAFRDQSLFIDKTSPLTAPAFEMETTGISGRYAYTGGYYTHPDYQGRGLIGFVSQLIQARAFDLWRIDHAGGFVRANHEQLALNPASYGFRKLVRTKVSYCAGTARPENLTFVWIDRADLDARYRAIPAYRVREKPVDQQVFRFPDRKAG